MPFSLERTPLENGTNLISVLNEKGDVVAQIFLNAAGEVVGAFENSKDHLLEISTRYQDLSDPSRHSTSITLVNASNFYDRPVNLYLNHDFWGEGDQYKKTIAAIPLNADRSPVAVAQALSAQVGAGGLQAKSVATANETTYIMGSEKWGLGGRDSLAIMIAPKPGQTSGAFLANVPVNNNLYIDIIEATDPATGDKVKFNGLNIDLKTSTSSVEVVEYTPNHFELIENGWRFVYGRDVSTGKTLPLESFKPSDLIDFMKNAYRANTTVPANRTAEISPSLSATGSVEATASRSGALSASHSVDGTGTASQSQVASRSWTETVRAGMRRASSSLASATRSAIEATKSISDSALATATASATLANSETVKRAVGRITASVTESLSLPAPEHTATHTLPNAGTTNGEGSNVTMIAAAAACCGVLVLAGAALLYKKLNNSRHSTENNVEGGDVPLLVIGGAEGRGRDADSVSSEQPYNTGSVGSGGNVQWGDAILERRQNPLPERASLTV